MKDVVIVDTGLANIRSVEEALRRAGAAPRRAAATADVLGAAPVVLPGVGAFGPGMAALHRQGLAQPLRVRLLTGRPTLAVCLGLQLLCEGSDEAQGRRGLGVLPVHARRLDASGRVPHMGWCPVRSPAGASDHAYFAHSLAIPADEAGRLRACGWDVFLGERGDGFIAALRRGGVLACQFHPELSGAWGARLLRGWLDPDAKEAAA